MTAAQVIALVRLAWLIGGSVAVVIAIWALGRAREDQSKHISEYGNGAVLHAGRWRIVAASQELLKAVTITLGALLDIIDVVDSGPSHFGLPILILLALVPIEFAVKLVSDAINHKKLLDLITTESGAPEHRKMDEHTLTGRVQ